VSGYYYPHRKDDLDANLLKKNKHQISNHDAHKPQTTISMDLFHTVFVSQCYNPSFPYQTYKNHHDASSSLKHNASQHLLPTHISHPDHNFPPYNHEQLLNILIQGYSPTFEFVHYILLLQALHSKHRLSLNTIPNG